LSSAFFTVMSVCLSQPCTVLMVTRQLARSPDPCAKTTGWIELQFGMLIGLGQCHFVLDGCPIPNRPSVTFPGKGHSWLLNILLPYLTNGSSRHMVKIEHYTVLCRQRRCHGHIQLYGARRALGDLGRRRAWSVLELSQLSMCTE